MQANQCPLISPSDHSFTQCWRCWFQQDHSRLHVSLRVLCVGMWSQRSGFWRLGRAVNHVTGSVRGGTRRQGGDWDSAAGFPRTALIIEPTSDFVPRWQMVGWGGIQGGRFASIVRAHKLHKETIASAKSKNKYILKKKLGEKLDWEKNIISSQIKGRVNWTL